MTEVILNPERAILVGLAKSLIANGQKNDLAERYLKVCAELRNLNRKVKEVRRCIAAENALSVIGFQPPLSVAGQSTSAVIVRAEHLNRLGVPIAMEKDDKGRHRGMSIEDVCEALSVEFGHEFGAVDVMELYREFMSAHPALLSSNADKKLARIPQQLRDLRIEREALEARLTAWLGQHTTRTFAVAVDSVSLANALVMSFEPYVTLGYNGNGPMRINGLPVATLWGTGAGLAVVAVKDLDSLIGKPGDAVSLDFDLEGWDGWTDAAVVVAKSFLDMNAPDPRRFSYYSGAEVG